MTSARIVGGHVPPRCRLPQAIDLVIAANGAKVEQLDNRKGRCATTPYSFPLIPLVEELTEAKYRRLDPVPEAEADISSPPRRRQRHC